MKVYKFGGASVKNAVAVRNMAEILQGNEKSRLIVVVSAMGKTTNQLENLFHSYIEQKEYAPLLSQIQNYHLDIAHSLSISGQALQEIMDDFNKLKDTLKSLPPEYDVGYDRIIPFGELISTKIISGYLHQLSDSFRWVDVREVIKTDSNHRNAQVNWSKTATAVQSQLIPILIDYNIITQGFIGSDDHGKTTTLGREGSDFTGSILASTLKAESLTVWKDVPGILNADPKKIKDAIKFDHISYEEAAEMTYYGAKVIHPKTIRPLANEKIPLYVRPFLSSHEPGTIIHDVHTPKPQPSIIFKENQTLVSFKIEDFTFVNEHHISEILHTFTKLRMSVNLMQNSAISFSVCMDTSEEKLNALIKELSSKYSIFYNTDLQIITVKNYSDKVIHQISEGQEVLLEQRTRHNFQIVVKS